MKDPITVVAMLVEETLSVRRRDVYQSLDIVSKLGDTRLQ